LKIFVWVIVSDFVLRISNFMIQKNGFRSGTKYQQFITGDQMDILKDLWGFMRVRKKFWLFPIITIMLILGGLIVFSGGSALAPFIYTLF